jgi:hypothetical protein
MADVKITDMTPGGTGDGTEIFAVSKGAAARSITAANLKDYIIAQIEAISAGTSYTGSDSVFSLQGGSLVPIDVDEITTFVLAAMWAKTAETSVDDLDLVPLHDGGSTEKVVTVKILSDYIAAEIEAAILDVSDVADGSGTIATTDFMLVTQTTTPKRVQISDLSTLIYASLAAHVDGLGDIGTAAGGDKLYMVRAGVASYVTVTELETFISANLSLSGSGTTNLLAHWSNANTLAATYGVQTAFPIGTESATEIPTSSAVRGEMDTHIVDNTEIGVALVDADELLVYDASITTQRKTLLSRVWTYIQAKIVALTDVSTHGYVLDEDTLVSDDPTKLATQQSIKAYVDASTGPLLDEDNMASDSDTQAATQQSIKAYVDASGGGSTVKHLFVPASQMWPDGDTPCGVLETRFFGGSNGATIQSLPFSGSVFEACDFNLAMPPEWDLGTIKFKVLWTGQTGCSTSDTVEWEIKAKAHGNSDSMQSIAWGSTVAVTDTVLAANGNDYQLSDASAAITVGNTPAVEDLIAVNIRRDPVTDTMTEDALLMGVIIEYTSSVTVSAW